MTTTPPPEPLELTDAQSYYGDHLIARTTGRGVELATVHDGREPVDVELDRTQILQLIGWLGHAVNAEPCHLPTCQHIAGPGALTLRGYIRCSQCGLLFDPVAGHHCPPTHDGLYDDAQVQAWLDVTTPDHVTAYRDAHRPTHEITTPAELAAAADHDRLNVSPMVDHLPGCTLTHNPTSSACPPFGHPMRQGEARTLEVEGEPQP